MLASRRSDVRNYSGQSALHRRPDVEVVVSDRLSGRDYLRRPRYAHRGFPDGRIARRAALLRSISHIVQIDVAQRLL